MDIGVTGIWDYYVVTAWINSGLLQISTIQFSSWLWDLNVVALGQDCSLSQNTVHESYQGNCSKFFFLPNSTNSNVYATSKSKRSLQRGVGGRVCTNNSDINNNIKYTSAIHKSVHIRQNAPHQSRDLTMYMYTLLPSLPVPFGINNWRYW